MSLGSTKATVNICRSSCLYTYTGITPEDKGWMDGRMSETQMGLTRKTNPKQEKTQGQLIPVLNHMTMILIRN